MFLTLNLFAFIQELMFSHAPSVSHVKFSLVLSLVYRNYPLSSAPTHLNAVFITSLNFEIVFM